ncbi:MAG: hypothetical protein KIS88_06190 [Anaerolineales bacterium]|nr:hypothetical protein [Anaerolineales bacterium]
MPSFALDIQSFIRVASFVLLFFGMYALFAGRASIRSASEVPFYRVRQQRKFSGWRSMFIGILLLAVAAWFGVYGERTAYRIFPVTQTPTLSPTPSLTFTPSLTPSLTLTPSETPTLQFTLTPSITPVPVLPGGIAAEFTSQVTPSGAAVFSPFVFARGINLSNYQPIGAAAVFEHPVSGIYALFSYDQMQEAVQWTALWYHNGDLVHYETKPWDGGTGGLGYTEWLAPSEEWLPGRYQVEMYVGTEVKLVGNFEVIGQLSTSTPTPSPTPTSTPSPTRTPTPLPSPTHTRQPTATSQQ